VRTTQFSVWDPSRMTREYAARISRESKESGVGLAAVWAGTSGPAVWDFIDGPATLGLVPPQYRAERVAELKKAADFAAWAAAPAIITHCGFVPENPKDPLYGGTLADIVEVGRHCATNGIGFWFESGQETPVVLLRVIGDSGLANLGVNLDTANLVLYGKANPFDALDVIGRHVRSLHAKDGRYPTNGRELGREVPLGPGTVDFPTIIRRLRELEFTGQIIIEREISGPEQAEDIRAAVAYLQRIVAGVWAEAGTRRGWMPPC